MSFNAGSISSSLNLDVSDFAQGMLQANSIAAIFPQTVQNFLANPLLGFIGILQDATRAMIGFFNEGTARADKMNDLAASIGVSVEALSGWGLVAEQAGSSTDAVADAFKFLGKNAAEAAGGSTQAMEAFARVGISSDVVNANLSNLDVLLGKVADGIQGLSSAERTAAAMDLLGRSGTDLIPALRQGSKEIDLQRQQFALWGAVITKEAAESADKFGDAEGAIGIAWRGIKQLFSDDLRIKLVEKLTELLDWITAHQEEIKAFAKKVADWVIWGFEKAGEAVAFLADHWKAFAAVVVGGTLLAGIAAAIIALGALAAAYDKLAASIARATTAQAGFSAGSGGILTGLGKILGGAAVGGLVGAETTDNTGGMVGGAAGGALGGWGGAAGGAAIGTAVFPGVGTAIGGILGWLLGALGGGYLGAQAGSAIEDAFTKPNSSVPPQGTSPTGMERFDNGGTIFGVPSANNEELAKAAQAAVGNTDALRNSINELSKASGDLAGQMASAAQAASDTSKPVAAVQPGKFDTNSASAGVVVQAVNFAIDPDATADRITQTLRPIITEQVRLAIQNQESAASLRQVSQAL